jgi:hypothetical protein
MASLRESVEEPKGTTRKKSRQGTGAVPRHRSRANPVYLGKPRCSPGGAFLIRGRFAVLEKSEAWRCCWRCAEPRPW